MNTQSGRGLAAVLAMTMLATLTGTRASAQQNFKVLASFDETDGFEPDGALVQGLDGNLYGTTYYGGDGLEDGTIFRITPTGTLTMLYSFCAQSGCADGTVPVGGLLLATDGNFYGTTFGGGAHRAGTVFRVTPGGSLTTLYSFCAQAGCPDGAEVLAPLIQGTDGNFYGTSEAGGSKNSGTVFRITPAGKFTRLHSFCALQDCKDGLYPGAPLIQATDGSFYGTTLEGGDNNTCLHGTCGTVFRITGTGTFTTLHSFDGLDGSYVDGLVQGSDGDFYGTTTWGGAQNWGTVFKMTPSGTLTTIYSFCTQTNCTDGSGPPSDETSSTLIEGNDGNFYGTTYYGGIDYQDCPPYGCGTVFKITPAGSLTTLHSFNGSAGAFPQGLAQATNGAFYGATFAGGSGRSCYQRCGTVFGITVGLGPFVETLPHTGKTGAAVEILGTDLTGATGVTFNGISATFNVASSSEITTTVPSGAKSGPVEVVTPGGTLRSNVPFRVVQ